MSATMNVILLIRQGVLGATILFSVVVLGISANLISQSQSVFGGTFVSDALAVAVAVISLVTLPVMLIVDIVRRGAFTSMIVVELSWLSVLWVLWVATAGERVTQYDFATAFVCDYLNGVEGNGVCQQAQAIEAFSFLNFILLLLYTGFLTIMAVIAASRGQRVWLSSVREYSLGARAGPTQHPMAEMGRAGV